MGVTNICPGCMVMLAALRLAEPLTMNAFARYNSRPRWFPFRCSSPYWSDFVLSVRNRAFNSLNVGTIKASGCAMVLGSVIMPRASEPDGFITYNFPICFL